MLFLLIVKYDDPLVRGATLLTSVSRCLEFGVVVIGAEVVMIPHFISNTLAHKTRYHRLWHDARLIKLKLFLLENTVHRADQAGGYESL